MTPICATIAGIVLQLFGGGYLVFQSWRTSRDLSRHPETVTFGELAPTIDTLTRELRRQFREQMIGFVFVVVGSGLQLYAVAAA